MFSFFVNFVTSKLIYTAVGKSIINAKQFKHCKYANVNSAFTKWMRGREDKIHIVSQY